MYVPVAEPTSRVHLYKLPVADGPYPMPDESKPHGRIPLLPKPRRMRWAGHVARIGEKMNAYRILVGKPEGK
jgi:hypothetical protein